MPQPGRGRGGVKREGAGGTPASCVSVLCNLFSFESVESAGLQMLPRLAGQVRCTQKPWSQLDGPDLAVASPRLMESCPM
ncbi:hypothetical protein VTJ04DRAFT_3681 [Mycothermus thermophilus]|uniref:uncharacterized protein n=1 Tax=Humicola insolens TaxID=85995 RepID=UPI003743732A